MKTLLFFRHAKSAWNNPGLGDFDRPLAPRGEKAAPMMGRFMEEHDLVPEVVICSTARRARQTCVLASREWDAQPEIRYEEGLYHAGPNQILQMIHALPEQVATAMLVGHNPGFHSLASTLTGSGDETALDELEYKFPTAGLAVLDFDAGWSDISPGSGRLRLFQMPRGLN